MRHERVWLWLAQRLPRNLLYWAIIVAWAKATSGKHSNVEVPAVSALDLLDRI